MDKTKRKIKMYHYTLKIPNSVLTLSTVPKEAEQVYETLTSVCSRAAQKFNAIKTGFMRGNAFDDASSSFITYPIPKPKAAVIAILEEIITYLDQYVIRTSPLNESYEVRRDVLALSSLRTILYVVKHSKYSVSYIEYLPFYYDTDDAEDDMYAVNNTDGDTDMKLD